MCVCVPANVRTYLRCEAKAMLIHILFVSRNYEGSLFVPAIEQIVVGVHEEA